MVNNIYLELEEAAEYIGDFLRLWGRIHVFQTKEKYGTVRVYCEIGSFHYPLLDRLIRPYQEFIYRLAYKKAIQKWPEHKHRILGSADYSYLLENL